MSDRIRRRLADQLDLWPVAIFALFGLFLVALDAPPILRTIVGLPLVLFLPGYALAQALFPSLELPTVERLLISAGASIALAILTGLVLAAAGHLNALGWASALTGLTVVCIVIAWGRRLLDGTTGPRPNFPSMPRLAALMLVAAVLIAANAVVGARLFAAQSEEPGPLQMWMLPAEESANDLLLGVRAGAEGGRYRVVLAADGEQVYDFAVVLDDQETWETIVRLSPRMREQTIVARLFEAGQDEELRRVMVRPAADGG